MDPSPHRIVLIEDNPADTLLLRHALDEQGEPYVMEVLRDGKAAIRYIREQCPTDSPEPCLIVLDLHLPLHDGATVLREIKSHDALAKVSVAVVTTSVSPKERAEVLELGVTLYRTKPMNWDENIELARELIDLCKGPRTLAAGN